MIDGEDKKEPKEHFETTLSFAKWRVNELKKDQDVGIINETIATVIESVNGILGQYNNSPTWGNAIRLIMPCMIYISFAIVTFGNDIWFSHEFNLNVYRILALLVLYIISYAEMKYSYFVAIFITGIVIELLFIILNSGSGDS
jgi:cation transport ATPase